MASNNVREENIQDRLNTLQSLFTRIQQDLEISNDVSNQDQPMKVHAFNSVNIDEARLKFSDSIDQIREVMKRHSSHLLVDKEQVTLNRYLKRLQDRNNYEKQFKSMESAFEQCQQIGNKYIQESISQMKESRRSDSMNPLKKSLSVGFSAREQHQQKINQTIHRLKEMGAQLGLQFWTEMASEGAPIESVENAHVQISLSSVALLIDVYLDSFGTILQVTLTLEDGTQKPEYNFELGQSLRRGIEDFAGKITKLTDQDKLYQELKAYNLRGIKTIMENDLLAIHRFESQSKSEIDLLLKHHGLMKNSCEGVVIHFYLPKSTLSQWESSQQKLDEFLYQNSLKEKGTLVYSLLLGVEKSKLNRNRMYLNPQVSIQNGQIVFAEDSSEMNPSVDSMEIDGQANTSSAGVPARFVLFGNLTLCATSFQRLLDVLSGTQRDWNKMNEYLESAPLERLLSSNKASPQMENHVEVNGVKQNYVFNGTCNINSGTIQVRRIPFSRVNQLLPILKIIRQQLVFNDLFSSCFSQSLNPPESKSSIFGQKHVLEVVTDAPQSINLTLMHPKKTSLFTVHILIGLNGEIQANSEGEDTNAFEETLRQSMFVPLAVNRLLESISKS